MRLELTPTGLARDGHAVADVDVRGFHEGFDPWRARVWIEVAGPGWRVPVDDGYGPLRAALRARYGDRPFTAAWARSGRFDGLVLGAAPALGFAVALVAVLAMVAAVGAWTGPGAGVAAALGWAWVLGRLRPAVVVRADGLGVGPAWAPVVPWHEVEAVTCAPTRRGVRLRAVSVHGVATATVPRASWPACRARIARLGGLEPVTAPWTLDTTYRAWRAIGVGAPWGALAGGLALGAAAASWPALGLDPFRTWSFAVVLAGIAGFVGAAVEARVSGWRGGGVLWMTWAYAGVLVVWALL